MLNLVNIACVDVSFQLQDLREGEGERCWELLAAAHVLVWYVDILNILNMVLY
jgi:hypothetical protein